MDPFVQRLVRRLLDPAKPLSRNRHFHTFDTPEGRAALRLSRRLLSLHKDIQLCLREGKRAFVIRRADGEEHLRMELRFERIHGHRVTFIPVDEYELLLALPGVRQGLTELPAKDAA
ncbi:MAG: hypothetical protein ACT4TC_26355 [Myxococcaceae bacterium]